MPRYPHHVTQRGVRTAQGRPVGEGARSARPGGRLARSVAPGSGRPGQSGEFGGGGFASRARTHGPSLRRRRVHGESRASDGAISSPPSSRPPSQGECRSEISLMSPERLGGWSSGMVQHIVAPEVWRIGGVGGGHSMHTVRATTAKVLMAVGCTGLVAAMFLVDMCGDFPRMSMLASRVIWGTIWVASGTGSMLGMADRRTRRVSLLVLVALIIVLVASIIPLLGVGG